ncbi:ethanolamine permease [Edaphobacter sp. HDX4]|uniref:ethanolamine permease n=1 Tax=Edaphobacter sp. HDX4 TaxID=2794064 RepID=UPI002FE62F5E
MELRMGKRGNAGLPCRHRSGRHHVRGLYLQFYRAHNSHTSSGRPLRLRAAGLRRLGGYIAGASTLVEFLFAPPAIALAIGAYLNVQFPGLAPKHAAVFAYLFFMAINIMGVKVAANFELLITLLAIFELLVFMGVVAPGFHLSNFVSGGWAGHNHISQTALHGMFAAVPFAIWFFLAIEGVAMAAEEAERPSHSIPIASLAGIGTLLTLALGVMFFAGGVGNWRLLANINDPLPQAMKIVVGSSSGWLHMLVWLGLFGLIASLHGIIFGYSRQIFALARARYLPAVFGRVHPKLQTPWIAVLAGGVVGIAAIYSDSWITIGGQPLTANIVTMSVLGALVMYATSMLALFRLRKKEPDLERPFRARLYPFAPLWTLFSVAVCLASIIYYNPLISLLFFVLLFIGYLLLRAVRRVHA